MSALTAALLTDNEGVSLSCADIAAVVRERTQVRSGFGKGLARAAVNNVAKSPGAQAKDGGVLAENETRQLTRCAAEPPSLSPRGAA